MRPRQYSQFTLSHLMAAHYEILNLIGHVAIEENMFRYTVSSAI